MSTGRYSDAAAKLASIRPPLAQAAHRPIRPLLPLGNFVIGSPIGGIKTKMSTTQSRYRHPLNDWFFHDSFVHCGFPSLASPFSLCMI